MALETPFCRTAHFLQVPDVYHSDVLDSSVSDVNLKCRPTVFQRHLKQKAPSTFFPTPKWLQWEHLVFVLSKTNKKFLPTRSEIISKEAVHGHSRTSAQEKI